MLSLLSLLLLFTICNTQNQTICFWGRGEGANGTVTNTILNGEYIESGIHNGFPYYTQILPNSCQQTTSIVELVLFRSSTSTWRICKATNSSICLAFCNAINDTNPTSSSSCNGLWQVGSEIDSLVTVTTGSCPSSSCIGGITTSFNGNTPCTNTHFTTPIAANAWMGYNNIHQQNVYFYFATKYFSFVCASSYDIGCNINIWDSTKNDLGWQQMNENENITLEFEQSVSNILIQCHDTPEPTLYPTFYPTIEPSTSYPTTISPSTSLPTTFSPTLPTVEPTTSIPTSIPTTIPTTIPSIDLTTTVSTAVTLLSIFVSSNEDDNSDFISALNIKNNLLYIISGAVLLFILCLICIICCTCCKLKKEKRKQIKTDETTVAMEKLQSLSSDGEIEKNQKTDILSSEISESDEEVKIKIEGNTGAKMDRYTSEHNDAMLNTFQSQRIMHNNNNVNNVLQMNHAMNQMNMQLQQQQMQQQMQLMQQMQQMNMQLPSQPMAHTQQTHYKIESIDANQLPDLNIDNVRYRTDSVDADLLPDLGETHIVEGGQ